MKITNVLRSRSVSLMAAVAVLLAAIAPALTVGTVSAGTVTSRKMEMSTSQAGATGTTYKLTFTPATSGTNYVLDFCTESPIYNQTCTAPAGMVTNGATANVGTVDTAGATNGRIKMTASLTAATPHVVTFSGITNPTTVSVSGFYARIATYTSSGNYATYSSASNIGTFEDTGGIAMNISNPIGVSASVRETLTFCVSALAPGPGCGTSGVGGQAPTTPNITLGHGSPAALDFTTTDAAAVYSQVSSNALSGVVVNMKAESANNCGGMRRSGQSTCEIAANGGTASTLAGSGKIGLAVGSPVNATGGTPAPAGTLAAISPYNGTGTTANANSTGTFALDGTEVVSTYGDDIFNSGAAPVADKNIPLTFAASASTTTPAGNYSVNYYLIATGTF